MGCNKWKDQMAIGFPQARNKGEDGGLKMFTFIENHATSLQTDSEMTQWTIFVN